MYRIKFNLKISIVLAITGFFQFQTFAQNNWDVPADKKSKNSNLEFNTASAKEGEGIYNTNCKSCHGDMGKNNSLKSLKPVPPDLTSTGSKALLDGELFYILNTGRGLMPSFKEVLPENNRWKVISYMRSFDKDYVQIISKTDPSKSNLVKINMVFDSITNTLKVDVIAIEKSKIVTLKNSEIALFVTRHFGKMQLDKTLRTDVNGIAVFNFPKDLPGDKVGNVELIVRVNDEIYGEIESINKLKIAVPTDKPSLTEKRAMWNVLVKAPIWVIFLYLFGVLLATSVILYIIYNLYKLSKSINNLKN
jgi:mono/diheme cytochrome c family protein